MDDTLILTRRIPAEWILKLLRVHKTWMASENTLVRAKRLDQATLTKIHDRYYPEVYRYVRYRLDNEQVCEDITAEVFLRLLDALHKNRGPNDNIRGWLFGTASNLVNDHLRQRYARKEEPLEGSTHSLTDNNHPEGAYEDAWVHQQVRDALQELTAEQQHVLALRFSQERSLEETAGILGKTVTAVKALQFRAVASLRRLLEDRLRR